MNATAETPQVRGGIQGHLRLLCAPDSRGVTSLREQSFRAPIHLSKPHWDQNTLVLNVVNPTAGLLQDDRMTQEATVARGAGLVLTMPGASRAHRVRDGWAALEQRFTVENGGFLEVLPEVFIPQAGACYRQSTLLRVEEGGELLYFESLAPGRTASGEVFQYRWLDWRTDLHIGKTHTARERLRLEPGTPSMRALAGHFPTAYYASAFGVSPKFENNASVLQSIHALHGAESWVGVSPLAHPHGLGIRIVSQSAINMRDTLHKMRRLLHAGMGRPPADLRRTTGR